MNIPYCSMQQYFTQYYISIFQSAITYAPPPTSRSIEQNRLILLLPPEVNESIAEYTDPQDSTMMESTVQLGHSLIFKTRRTDHQEVISTDINSG